MATNGNRYTVVAIILHWLIAAGVLALIAIGLTMAHGTIAAATKFKLFQLHKSIGITILLLSLFRLVWRLMHPAPPLPAHMPAWEKAAARASHFLF